MTGRSLGLWAFVVSMALPGMTLATSWDYVDETMVSRPFKAREVGFELGLDSRLDRDYRLQGWYAFEVESAPTSRWFVEGVLQTLTRGSGMELAGWKLGTRLRLVSRPAWPADVTAAVEYEVQTGASKHPFYERELVPRLVLSRDFPARVSATLNVGSASRISVGSPLGPPRTTKFAYGGGIRYPEGAPLMVGVEALREPLERSTRITPQMWIQLPGEARMRLGGVFGTEARPYWFVARAIVEAEF